nr:DUF5060 domain-containing protein [Bryobacter sp.]
MRSLALLLCTCTLLSAKHTVTGEPRLWHRVTVTFDGPPTAEDATPNPFRDFRLQVTFTHASGAVVKVPGFFVADGNAAESSAASGNRWRVHFTPDREGEWRFQASFRTGPDVALSLDDNAGSPTAFDGEKGSVRVASSDKKAPDFRAKGLLRYTGDHYLRFAGSGERFVKGGADSPENFLAYFEFDGTRDLDAGFKDSVEFSKKPFVHEYAAHARDWKPGDPVWQKTKGRNIIPDVRDRFDVSKLDQWEIVFSHMDRLGLQLHVITHETENDRKLGGGPGLNPIRKLYLRELVARFGHHLAVMWNLGEENNMPDQDRKEIAAWIRALDPYDHPITVHTHNNKAPDFYNGILGDSNFEATSIQGNMQNYHRDALVLRERSAKAGRKWAIYGDEQPAAKVGVMPDADDPAHDIPRIQALWGNLLGGGSGVEWYFGYAYPHMDLNCEDWRSRDRMWDQTRYALEFFHRHLPFWEMEPAAPLASGARVFAKPGAVYAVQLPKGGSAELPLPPGKYRVLWFNPRSGGELQRGSLENVAGGE